MKIRCEAQRDFDNIFTLVKTAFETAMVSDGNEQNFVNKLRDSDNYIPELALVAENNGILLGHIMLTKFCIVRVIEEIAPTVLNEASKHETLLLGPISVVLEQRGCGIGSKLIREAFDKAVNLGYKSVVLVGNPAYYSRFGFKKSEDFGIRNTNGIPSEYVMICELVPGSLESVEGEIYFDGV